MNGTKDMLPLELEASVDDDWLASLLEEDSGYIEDDGFTAGVVARLPAPTRSVARGPAMMLVTVIAAALSVGATGLDTLTGLLEGLRYEGGLPGGSLAVAGLVMLALCFTPMVMALED